VNGEEKWNFETKLDISLDNSDNKEDRQCREKCSGNKSNAKGFIDPDKNGIQKQANWIAIAFSDAVKQSK